MRAQRDNPSELSPREKSMHRRSVSGSTRLFGAPFFRQYLLTITHAARLREGRNALLRAAAYQFSMRRLDNYFPLPDPFHAALSKTAGLGTGICPRARTRKSGACARRSGVHCYRNCICRAHYHIGMRADPARDGELKTTRQSSRDNLYHGNYTPRFSDRVEHEQKLAITYANF